MDEDLKREVEELRQRVARLEALLQPRTEVAPLRTPPPRQPSLETTIGSQWLNRVGILAVLVAMALFLKLAIDNHWLGPAARVAVGMIGGLVLMGLSEWFRKRNYVAFSYSLKGIGTGLLYLSLWASFTLFHLLAAPVAGAGLIAVTAANGLLAWRQNSLVLAIYSVCGGLISPLLLANGYNHELALFSYLLLLALGSAALALLRSWNVLLLLSFYGNALYAVFWAFSYYRPDEFAMTLAFAVAGFLLFAAVPVVPAQKLRGSELLIVLTLSNALGGLAAAAELFSGLSLVVAALAIAGFYYGVTRYELVTGVAGDAPWAPLLDANLAMLVGVTLWIHWLWRGTGPAAVPSPTPTGEQLSYSLWFMFFGAALVATGFWRRTASLRWQGLVLLLCSVTKVFLFDTHSLSEASRVFSFLGLGLLLLVVSFVYQRDWLKLRNGKA